MSTFTGSERECISSLEIATSPSCSFAWGEIASIILPSLMTSEPASSTTTFGRSLLCPTLRLHSTPTSHTARTVLLPKLHLNLTIARSLSRATKALLQQLYHKKAGIQQNRIASSPSTSSAYVPNRVLRCQQYVVTSSSPPTFKIVRRITPTSRSLTWLISLQG